MAPTFHWFLPTAGDGRQIGNSFSAGTKPTGHRTGTIDYLAQVAQAAEYAGFDACLTPTGAGCDDAWLVCAALAQRTTTLRFLVAFRPGFTLPTLAAQQAQTFQRISGGRLLVNIVTGGDPVEQAAYGDHLAHDERYDRTGEFVSVVRQAWEGERFDFDGAHYDVRQGGLLRQLKQVPPIFFGGASPAAEVVAAKHADVYLMWGEPPAMLQPRLDRMRERFRAEGREAKFGIRLHVISRETPEEAWLEADRLLAGMTPDAVAAHAERISRMDSVGQARMSGLHGHQTAADLLIAPNLWAGIGLVRDGAATALVGSHEQVAERLDELHAMGYDHFILSGYPHVEEAYRVGECVIPLVADRPRVLPESGTLAAG